MLCINSYIFVWSCFSQFPHYFRYILNSKYNHYRFPNILDLNLINLQNDQWSHRLDKIACHQKYFWQHRQCFLFGVEITDIFCVLLGWLWLQHKVDKIIGAFLIFGGSESRYYQTTDLNLQVESHNGDARFPTSYPLLSRKVTATALSSFAIYILISSATIAWH